MENLIKTVDAYKEELNKLSIKQFNPIKNLLNRLKVDKKILSIENTLCDEFKYLTYDKIRKMAELYHYICGCSEITGNIFYDHRYSLLPTINKIISGDNYIEIDMTLSEIIEDDSIISKYYHKFEYIFIFKENDDVEIQLMYKYNMNDNLSNILYSSKASIYDFALCNDCYEHIIFIECFVKTLINATIGYIEENQINKTKSIIYNIME